MHYICPTAEFLNVASQIQYVKSEDLWLNQTIDSVRFTTNPVTWFGTDVLFLCASVPYCVKHGVSK